MSRSVSAAPSAGRPASAPRDPNRIYVVSLSGGPCAGKSSAMAMLRQKLATYGVSVFVVPELATELFTNGVEIGAMLPNGPDDAAGHARFRDFQAEIIKAIIARETYWTKFAALQPGGIKLVVCDRGVMDGKAYIDPATFDATLYDLGLSVADARDKRYDAVIHLVTAAYGAEQFYTLENNAGRSETPDQARALDDRTRAAWTGHRALSIVGNTTVVDGVRSPLSFAHKLERVLAEVCRVLNLPMPSRREQKYLVAGSVDRATLPLDAAACLIEQTYLATGADGAERRVRKVEIGAHAGAPGTLYVYTEKRDVPDGGRVKTERVLKAREYLAFLADADRTRSPVVKRRTSFAYEDQYFHLDEFASPAVETLLEVELTEGQTVPVLPPFIPIERDVTAEPEFRNANLAHRPARGR